MSDSFNFKMPDIHLPLLEEYVPDPPATAFVDTFRREWVMVKADARSRGMMARLSLITPVGLLLVGRIGDLDGHFLVIDAIPTSESVGPRRLYLHHSSVQLMVEFVAESSEEGDAEDRRGIGFNVEIVTRKDDVSSE